MEERAYLAQRAWRLIILSGLGVVLCAAVAVILIGVLTSGSASSDDIGLPAVFAAVLVLVCLGGLGVGISRLRALR
jgi:hypothetical protein